MTKLNAKVSATKVCPGCSARYPPDALFCPNDGSPLTATPVGPRDSDAGLVAGGDGQDSYLGREISGHIEIRKLAGVGAMGRVYRAFQKGIDRDVAVKVLHRELSANQQLVARFHREAKVASRLQHPNVVQVHLAGQLPDGAMYIVMEYLDGLSLQSALAAAGGPLPLERALHIALQICDAVGEAHSQGVIHRDIKPENVMLIRRGDDPDFVKVLDFGIARLNWGEQSMATAAGLIFGTARYISPEGAQGEAVGPEGDVYATATLLYQMLAGRTPFEGEQAVALLVQQIHDAPPPIRSIPAAAKVPAALADVIMKNLSKTPADRAPDGRTFGRAIVEAAKTVGLSPEDLVPRSSLFVPAPRMSDPSSLGSTARKSETAVPPVSSVPSGAVVPTVRDPAVPDFGPLGKLPPGMKTQKWSPSEGAGADLTPSPTARVSDAGEGASDRASAAPPEPHAFPPPSRPKASSVDTTLDDSSSIRLPPVAGDATRMRTEPGMPLGAIAAILASPTPAPPLAVAPAAQASSPDPLGETLDDGLGGRRAPEELEPPPRNRRLAGVIVVCFLIGVMGALFALYQLNYIGSGVQVGSLDAVVARADDALRHARWDTPPGDNVRDLTNDALKKWPHDPRILDLRARATDELVKAAVGRKLDADLPGALHWARLANELDPTDTTAQHLVEEYQRAGSEASPSGSVDAATSVTRPVPAIPSSVPSSRGSTHTQPPTPPPATPPRVAFEASLAHPHVGQPVSLTAKVLGAKAVDDARFLINGPGLTADTKLGTVPEAGGGYQTTFTGFEAGKYDITFEAKIDGTLSRAARTIVIEASSGQAAPSSAPSLPSTVPSGKWL